MTTSQDRPDYGHRAAGDAEGNRIGKISKVYLDDQTGQPRWVLVETGLFGTRQSFAPIHGSRLDGELVVLAVSKDQVKDAPNIDPDLKNPWGISQFPGGALWVSDNHTGLSTLYDPNTGVKAGLIVTIPGGAPTGQVAVPGGHGFTVTEGCTTHDEMEAHTDLAFIRQAARTVVIADSSKIGKVTFARICGPEVVNTLVTDSGIDPDMQSAIESANIEVIAASVK